MKKLTKSATDRQVSGVLGGIAEYFGIDSTIVRVLFLILSFAGIGSPVFLYFILAILMPEPNRNARNEQYNRKPYGDNHRESHNGRRPRKEAKPVQREEKVDEDDWSDF